MFIGDLVMWRHYNVILDGLWCLTPLSTIFQLYCGGHHIRWMSISWYRYHCMERSKRKSSINCTRTSTEVPYCFYFKVNHSPIIIINYEVDISLLNKGANTTKFNWQSSISYTLNCSIISYLFEGMPKIFDLWLYNFKES